MNKRSPLLEALQDDLDALENDLDHLWHRGNEANFGAQNSELTSTLKNLQGDVSGSKADAATAQDLKNKFDEIEATMAAVKTLISNLKKKHGIQERATKLSSQQLRSIIVQEVKKSLKGGKKHPLKEVSMGGEDESTLQDLLKEIQDKFVDVTDLMNDEPGLEERYFAKLGPALRAVDEVIEDINQNNPDWFDLASVQQTL